MPSPVRVLGICGFLCAILTMIGGFINNHWLIGIGSMIMVVANIYAIIRG